MEDCSIITSTGIGRLRKTMGQTIKRYLEVNGLLLDLIHDRTSGC